MGNTSAIICTACGEDTLVKCEPEYDGFVKVGEKYVCVSCGHCFGSEAEVPFKEKAKMDVLSDDDMPKKTVVFGEDERGKNCRYCKHYVINPFTQRCGLHQRVVQATDMCGDFEMNENDEKDDGSVGN